MVTDLHAKIEQPSKGGGKGPGRRRLIALGLILATASLFRCVRLADWPPGLHQDEAIRAWNGQCLLKTGRDYRGQPWPLFYTNAFGSNTSTLHDYMQIPLQAVGGLNIWTVRLPGAIAGVVSVLLAYVVAARLFGAGVGLIAAGLLAVSPWAVQADRTGMGVSVTGPVALLVLLLLLRAGAPFSDGPPVRYRPLWAALAGAVAGMSCYAYPAWRLFIPAFALALFVAVCPDWLRMLKSRKSALVPIAFALALAVTLGPLAWKQASDPASRRATSNDTAWEPTDSPIAKVVKVLARYPGHFGLDFLFREGDRAKLVSPPHGGQLHWYMLPLLAAGAIVVLWKSRSSRAARVLLAFVLVYPVGDILFARPLPDGPDPLAPHSLRSYPGMTSLYLLAAVGTMAIGAWIYRRRRRAALALGGVLLASAVAMNAFYYPSFFRDFGRDPDVYHGYHADLVEATRWLRPRLNQYDAVFCTCVLMNQPYVIMLVVLDVEPKDWFTQVRDFREVTYGRDGCVRWGKIRWMYWDLFLQDTRALEFNGRRDRVLFLIQPGLIGLPNPKTVYEVRGPDGQVSLAAYEVEI